MQEGRSYYTSRDHYTFTLPDDFFGPFQALTQFGVQSRTLSKLPDSLFSLPGLQQLTLEGMGKLAAWPNLSHMHTLTMLVVQECHGNWFPDWDSFTSHLPPGLRRFECRSSESIVCLPGGTRRFTGLQCFLLETRCVKYIPALLSHFDCPQEVVIGSFYDSNETALPESMGQLTNLTALRLLDFSSLKSLPHSLGKLSSLKELEVEHCNYLEELPESLTNLQSLERVAIRECRALRVVPFVDAKMPALRVMEVIGCPMIGKPPPPPPGDESSGSWWGRFFS